MVASNFFITAFHVLVDCQFSAVSLSWILPICIARFTTLLPKSSPQNLQWNVYWFDKTDDWFLYY